MAKESNMRYRHARFFSALWVVIFSAAHCIPALAQEKPEDKAAGGAPVSMAGFEDKGEFQLYVNEDPIITTTFEWRKDGSFDEKFIVSMAGQKVETTMKFKPDEGGPLRAHRRDNAAGRSVV